MNKRQFIKELKRNLEGLPSEEIENAINYYSEYFEDAGIDEELDVTISLGTPKQVAEQIISDYSFRNSEELVKVNLNKEERNTENNYYESEFYKSEYSENKKKKKSKGIIILIVILAVLASPFILGLSIGSIGVIFGVLMALFGTLISLILSSGAVILGGLLCLVVSPFAIAEVGGATITLLVGLALIAVGFGTLLLCLSIKVLKLVILGCKKLITKIAGRRKKHE